jgi:carboxyl-terminal processing protease
MNRNQGTGTSFFGKWWKASSLAAVLLLMLFQGAGGGAQLKEIPKDVLETAGHEIDGYTRDFMNVLQTVQENYAEPVDLDKAIYNGAIPGILHVLDPHSNFFDPKSYAAVKEEEHGAYFGVGMTIAPRNNRVVVLAPFVGTPAYKAGIRPGDLIVAVNDRRTDGMTSGDVADLLKGPKGSVVRITIARPGTDKPLLFEITRDEIPRNAVDLQFMLRPGIGYMHVSGFNETTGPGVIHALKEMGNLQGLILDLRGNPGGLVNQVVPMAEQFLRAGQLVVSVRGRSFAEQVMTIPPGASPPQYPLVVLVNRGTASAAEIVSGALQDHDRGLIAGETTFGKGLVQNVIPLEDKTGLALTTARYYTPSGRIIQRNYSGVSLYDYYFNRETENPKTDVKQTEHGRTVYGGGGITPDVKIEPLKTTAFEDQLLQHYAFFNFAQQYLNGRTVDKNWEVTPAVMNDFKKFVTAQNIPFTEADLRRGGDWIKAQIKTEVFIAQFGQQEGLRVRAETDPQVQAALKLLPQAAKLLQAQRKESRPAVVAAARQAN